MIESPYGKTTSKIHISKRIHKEVVGLQHGFERLRARYRSRYRESY